ncbi:hypothetical protein, partial [Desulfovibrio piger]|uniref:hypothetical protein n=1 Tax=Desulfovibrio piger TaxID=901 RepID=UPI0037360578
ALIGAAPGPPGKRRWGKAAIAGKIRQEGQGPDRIFSWDCNIFLPKKGGDRPFWQAALINF